MDEKTEELRELFLEVADDETVTESQEEVRGSITVDDDEIEERLRSTIASMEERYDGTADRPGAREGFRRAAWETFAREDLVDLVRLFYAGEDDADIARELGGVDAGDVARARVDLHLVTEDDRDGLMDGDGPVESDELRDRLEGGESIDDVAADLGVSEPTLNRYRRVLEVEEERRLVGDRFRREFERILGERALSDRLTERVTEDGLEDATEGIETDVSF